MRKFNNVEKMIIATGNPDKFKTYDCKEHGIYQNNVQGDNKKCPRCKVEGEPIEVTTELQEKYKKDLGASIPVKREPKTD